MNRRGFVVKPEQTKDSIDKFLESYRDEIKLQKRYEPCRVGIEISVSKWKVTESGVEFEFDTQEDADLFARYKDEMPITIEFIKDNEQ